MHTILGANGVIGREISRNVVSSGDRVRQVSRSPQRVDATDEIVSADLTDPDATERAIAGSEVAYLVVGLKYETKVWREQWPRVMKNAIEGCKRHDCRLVFFDNVYAYGKVEGAMTEDTPFNPCSRKGDVRARIATMLLDEMRAGNVRGMIVRAADFYGPGAAQSLTHATVFQRLASEQAPQWVGNPKAVHTFTFTPDAGRAVASLAKIPEAYGQTWHLPTTQEPLSGEQFVRLACDLRGQVFRLQVAPSWLLTLMGLFVPVLRENREMMYQLENDYRFDSSKIAAAYGLKATPYQQGIAATLAAR